MPLCVCVYKMYNNYIAYRQTQARGIIHNMVGYIVYLLSRNFSLKTNH